MQIKEFSCARTRVCVDGGGSPPGQTDSRRNSEKKVLRGDGILSPQLILPYGSQRGCCYHSECLQCQNLWFQFLPRHHHFPLLERLWTPVTEKVTLLMSYDFCFSLMIVLVST